MMIGLEKYSKEFSLLRITVSGISIDGATGINLISEVVKVVTRMGDAT